jgi:iron complex outermembrane receptor protein
MTLLTSNNFKQPIMKKNKLTTALTVLGLFCINLLLAQTTVSGTVSDADTNEPIPGVNLIVQGTSEGTNSDFDGNFSFSSNQALPFTVEISSIGFAPQSVEVTSADQVLSIALSPGENLGEIVVSASRKPQKVQDAPASVSIITAKDIKNSADAVDPIRQLINIPGVQIQQQSANTINIEMRAGSGVFGTATFPILDYRYLVTPSAGQFLSYQTGLSNIDIAKVEVVRGAASALYGPGVTSGVVHFMSKNPIDYPGTTIELLAGTLNTLGANIRHAYANESKTLGFKINARVTQGDDFEVDPNDLTFISQQKSQIYQPSLSGGRVDSSTPGTLLLGPSDLDDNNDGNPLATKYKNVSANAHLELRPNDNTNAFLSAGIAKGGGLFFNSQGAGYANGTDYWTQARVQSGGFFGQLSYNYNDGGTDDEPTFLYASGFRQVAKRSALELQLQYNFDIPSFLNSNFTVGMDHRDIMSDSAGTLYGINDADDAYRITGVYLQGTTSLSEKLELTYAGRYDKFNFIDEGAFAPRVALVYKAAPKHTFRASYNIATFGPTALEQNIDFPVNIPAPGLFDIWLSGQKNEQNFSATPMIDITVPGVPDLPYGTPGLPLVVPYGAVAGNVLPSVFAALGANPATAGLVGPLNTFFTTYIPDATRVTGSLVPRNLFNGESLTQLVGTPKASIGTVSSWEVGYTGLIGDKLKVSADVYSYERKGFTQFTAIGPTYSLQGANIASDLSALVSSDVQAFLQSIGLPAPNAAAVAGAVGGGFALGGAGFAAAIEPLLSIIGVVETDAVPQGDGITHVPAGYRRFGDATRSHWGTDVSLEYFATDRMSIWANGSYISQNIWIPGQPDDDDLPFSSYLNSPQFKYRAGLKYAQDGGYRFSLSFQHDDSFESNQGVFSGTVVEKNLVDTNIGYDFGNGLELDLSATNLFDQKYSAFPSTPVIGRRAILKATYSF